MKFKEDEYANILTNYAIFLKILNLRMTMDFVDTKHVLISNMILLSFLLLIKLVLIIVLEFPRSPSKMRHENIGISDERTVISNDRKVKDRVDGG